LKSRLLGIFVLPGGFINPVNFGSF